MEDFEEEFEDMTATTAILKTIQELADKCKTLEEFKDALAKIIDKK